MKRFIEGESRQQVSMLPECLDDYIGEDNPVRIIDAFVEELDLLSLDFKGTDPAVTGRPAYHPAVLLKHGYLNRIQSSRRLEREAQRTVEHVFGTLKHWMDSTHFLTKTLTQVSTEMSLHVLAYSLKRVVQILGMTGTMRAMQSVGA